jgi:hypothetical protein
MVQDRLTKAVLRRLKELGLPPFLIEIGEFHNNFFLQRWVMFVRDGDDVANVRLIQPPQKIELSSRERSHARAARRRN